MPAHTSRAAQIQNAANTKCWGRCGPRGLPLPAGGVQNGTATSRKAVGGLLTKLNIFFPYNPATTLLGIYSKALKTYVHAHKKSRTQIFTARRYS